MGNTAGAPNYSSYGSTGGYTPGAGAGGGSGAMGYLGLASMLGGGILDYIGQTQGARAVEREAKRQAAEQEAFSQQKHQLLLDQLATIDPAAHQALTTGALMRSRSASHPAIAAGGKALGLSGAATRSVARGVEPGQRLQAGRTAGALLDVRRGQDLARLAGDTQGIQDRQDAASALYPIQQEIASGAGSGLRMGGQMLQGAGTAGLYYAMAQPGRSGSPGVSGDPTKAPGASERGSTSIVPPVSAYVDPPEYTGPTFIKPSAEPEFYDPIKYGAGPFTPTPLARPKQIPISANNGALFRVQARSPRTRPPMGMPQNPMIW